MDTIKDIWYAVIVNDKVASVFKEKFEADTEGRLEEEYGHKVEVERVRVTIDRIKS